MTQGYVAGLVHLHLRETRDGRVVTSRRVPPFFRRRWYYVAAGERQAFEARVIRAHFAAMGVLVVGVQFVREPLSLGFVSLLALIALVVVVQPVLQAWRTADLTVAHLDESAFEPLSRSVRDLRYARVLGARTLWGFLVGGVVLTSLQGVVAITDGAWWAWLGVVMVGTTTVYFGRLVVRLHDDDNASRET